jgi:lipoate-protein ligase B
MLDRRQRELAAAGRSAILLNEVSPVVTTGRRTPGSDLLLDQAALAARGIELYSVDRGGLATYHGPGQWVLFPVMKLEELTGDRRGVRKAVEGLLEATVSVCREYEPRAEIRSGLETGVWSPRGKLGAVGVHIENGVLLHGLSLNVFRTPESFIGIRPCGLEPRIDFLASEGEFEAVGERLVSAIFGQFFSSRPTLDLANQQGYTRDSHL